MFERREMLLMGGGLTAGAGFVSAQAKAAAPHALPAQQMNGFFDIRQYGARGDGKTIDTAAVNRAIDHAASLGGGTVHFPAGTYACHTIRLKSRITLHLANGAVLLAAPAPGAGSSSPGYDAAEPQDPAAEPYQDYGHNHWRNSLIWGEGLHDVAIVGQGMIWGKGLGRGHAADGYVSSPSHAGTGNKAIALKNCRNVLFRDFKVLEGGWFAFLLTGVDNVTIDNLLIDTNRDGIDIDCCRNVRVTNCTINSPWDDGIVPKSSFALGYLKPTENVMIANCYVTGNYVIGSVIDGSWKPIDRTSVGRYGRIKLGTESNGGFKNITVTNCVFDQCRGFALETVDGALCEDITISNCTMRGSVNSPLYLRLARRMRGPASLQPGRLRRIMISNIVSSSADILPSIIAGVPGHPIEDISISGIYFHQQGGAPEEMAAIIPPLMEKDYPEPAMLGPLPASGFYIRDAKNIEMSNIEIAVEKSDARPAFWLRDVDGADFFRVKVPAGKAFHLSQVRNFRTFGAARIADRLRETVSEEIF